MAKESIDKMRALGLDVGPGNFAENLTTKGISLVKLPTGRKIAVGDEVLLEVIQIGKACHNRCATHYPVGDCIMPKEGIFAKVISGGEVKAGDRVRAKE